MDMSNELSPTASQIENGGTRINVLLKKVPHYYLPYRVTIWSPRGESLLIFTSEVLERFLCEWPNMYLARKFDGLTYREILKGVHFSVFVGV
jgi:hypothetical protein